MEAPVPAPTLAAPEAADPPATEVVLEAHAPLSRSCLWALQRAFFEQAGLGAWIHGIVPHYVTSNPYLARAYAQVVFGFLRDVLPAPRDTAPPLYLIEIGAGSGRLAFHFLKYFERRLERSLWAGTRFKYVMTDFSERTLAAWQTHPALSPWVASGRLDFARFDVERDTSLTLVHSGETLTPGSLASPLVVIANYVFDSLPTDSFYVKDGQLHESLVTVHSSRPDLAPEDPQHLGHVRLSYERRPLDGAEGYYGDATLDELLEAYRQTLADTALSFPCASLRAIDLLSRLRRPGHPDSAPMLLLSGDKGYGREEELLDRGEPALVFHGSFSLAVNYHAIAEFVRRRGGVVLETSYPHASLKLTAYLLEGHAGNHAETRLAFDDAIEGQGPDDFFTLKKALDPLQNQLTLPQHLARLRQSGYDARVLLGAIGSLKKQAATAPEPLQRELRRALERVWDLYYPLGEAQDLAFEIGVLLYEMGYLPEAIPFFERSLMIHGADAATLTNLGMCHFRLRRFEAALERVDEALALTPEYEGARSLRIRIQAESR